ncbi:MAG: calcium-translocating P-type ATPase, PMCA-type [Candidatus Binatia bacterium]
MTNVNGARPGETPPRWHTLSAAEVAARLNVDLDVGLSPKEAEKRLQTHGPNELVEQQRRSVWRMLVDQFTDFMIIVLIAAAMISGLMGEPTDTLAIVVIVLLNGVIGFFQEYRAERAMAALKKLVPLSAVVRRGGHVETLPVSQLVPGDVVQVEAGNVIPADLRLIEAVQLKAEEAALTGESVPMEKHSSPLDEEELAVGDRVNMAYKGTLVTYGRGSGIVVATGMTTELGRIASLLHEEEEVKTPLQRRLAHFGQRLALAVLAICGIVFTVGVLQGKPVVLMFLTAVSLAVAAIPEALPAVITVSLALGARNMVKKHALIRRLPAVETLGSVTYICSDKTGTLTQNKMRVEQVYIGAGASREVNGEAPAQAEGHALLYTALALNNDATRNEQQEVIGDPTEVALYSAALEAGYDKTALEGEAARLAEIPFDSNRKRMTTFHRDANDNGIIAFTKGAPEAVLDRCALPSGRASTHVPMEDVLQQAEQMACDGLRVLAVAYRRWPELPVTISPAAAERDLTFLGLVGLLDPPREEAGEAVALCQTAGIIPVMVTGDHPVTARAIGARLGIVSDDDAVLTGQDLGQLSEKRLRDRVKEVRIYARVAPEQKIRIVKALQESGEFVAMTGDGVNDAPALKRANIGVAMGQMGTDVAREAAHMILLDDNFASIVAAIRAGRRVFDNIRKFIKYTMTSNSGEIWTIFLAPFLGLPIPLLPIHILWINLVTDGLPGLALAVEPEEQGIMQRPPRPPRESIFAHGLWQHILWVGLLMGGVSLVAQAWAYHDGSRHWQTMVFTVLTLSQMGHVLAIRSEKASFFQQGPWSNLPLLGAVVLTFVLQMMVIYLPVLNPIFKTQPLSGGEIVVCLILSSVVFVAVEIEKSLVRRGWLYKQDGESEAL